ncbi:dienelactone hydrolase family protein [Streptomyces sp. NPDC004014]
MHTPDLFDGRTFASIEEGFGFAREKGFDAIRERGAAAADDLGPELVYAGFSFGVTIAQRLAQTRPGARGALLIDSCLPVTEFGEAWPVGVPVQIHGKEGDEFFGEDLPAARELVGAAAAAELFVYPGGQHLFADSSLDAHDPEASRLLMERVRAFLASA